MYQLADNPISTPRIEMFSHPQTPPDQEQTNIEPHNSRNHSNAHKFDLLDENKEPSPSQSFLHFVPTKNSIALGGPESETPRHKDSLNFVQNNSSIHHNILKPPLHDVDPLGSFLQLKMSDRMHFSDIHSEESKLDEAKSMISKDSRPKLLTKKREELRRINSMDCAQAKSDLKEPASAETKSNDGGASFFSDIVISKKRGDDELKKSGFVKRNLLPSKPVTISLTFDAFVDQVKGHESASIASNYPSYKIDKRLIFLGKEVDYPWHIISYHSTFRRLWNLFIILITTYQIFWYPLAVTFIYGQEWPLGTFIFEIVSIFIFFIDIIINIRTTYSNENNEEIIDGKMMSKNYMKTKYFIIDIITTLPVPEILLAVLIESSSQWIVYSLVIMVRMLRCFKVARYQQGRTFSVFLKLLRIFITFFIFVHWASCVWFIIIKAEFPDPPTMQNLWFPNNLRMIATSEDDLLAFYYHMPTIKVYGFTLLSVFMLVVGSDMAPATDVQIWVSVLVGLFGAVSLAYIFGLVTLHINRANEDSQLYQQQLEELKEKLKVNKIPHNLRVKVMEYFYYSWRKHSVLKKMDDFSELSIPLQRDIALYQHQEMIMKVPLFKELDPVEILSIVQKLKTSIYMPGDKIIREGERGTEMFFIQEGIVEKFYKKAALKSDKPNSKQNYERVILKKGNYFGEVALVSNSKRIFDVNAFEFCILYSFSRSDYESLKSEFRDIGPRLRSGLKHYKNTHMEQLIQILKNLDIFHGFNDAELRRIGDEYLEEMFVDPDKVILAPKNRINAIYVIFAGNVRCYRDDDETKNYVNYLKRSDNKDNWTIVDVDEEEDIDCLDDDILNLEKDKLSMDDQKKRLDLVRAYTYGEYFGTLDFDVNEIKCNNYYLTDSGCQIGVITQALKSQMALESPDLYEKLRNNIVRCCPRRVMMAIEEESESSITTKNNTVIKRPSRRASVLSDVGKRPAFIKTMSINQNKEEDIAGMKVELLQLEEQMNYFKNLIISVNAKLANALPSAYPTLKSQETSPLKTKPRSRAMLTQVGSQAKISNKEHAGTLLGVDEEDQVDESHSIKKEEEEDAENLKI